MCQPASAKTLVYKINLLMNTTGNTRYAQLWKLIEITSARNR